jgi:ubiquinone/menaquinone biosynthesis C-methylase UbiE
MPRDRDVAAFDERAEGFEEGRLGRLHHEIADRTADLALARVPAPHQVLDVGSGTGYLLRRIGARAPDAAELVGVDAAADMIRVAREATTDPRGPLSGGHRRAPTGARRRVRPGGQHHVVR